MVEAVRYVTKPFAVEAVQWTGGSQDEIRDLAGSGFMEQDAAGSLWVRNARGPCPVHAGDWVVRQAGRPLRVVSPAAFEATFEPAGETP